MFQQVQNCFFVMKYYKRYQIYSSDQYANLIQTDNRKLK